MYSLPKIWQGRIQKYWDKIMPSDYPASDSVFDTKFKSQEETNAVNSLEENINKSTSEVLPFIPEGCKLSDYIGTYDVDGTPNVLTLLSPERVNSDNIKALHFNADTSAWEEVTDAHVVDGYVWGTLASFSPIAIVEYRKDIHVETSIDALAAGTYVVCEGNVVKITENDGVITLKSESTGTSITLNSKTFIIGGSVDGRHIDKTSITAVGITTSGIVSKIYGGSFFWSDDDTVESATVDSVNVLIQDSTGVGSVTGSSSKVRTNNVNITIKNSTINWTGCGESYNKTKAKDSNDPNCSLASKAWVKNSKFVLENVVSGLIYSSGNTGCLYVDHNEAIITGGNHAYLLNGGSNGGTNESVYNVKDAVVGVYQSTNRGFVNSAKATFTGCTVNKLYVGGDASDSTVTGTTKKIKYEINAAENDSYNIVNGTEAGVLLTAEVANNIVDSIKVSRSANVTINNDLKTILGSKYIVK